MKAAVAIRTTFKRNTLNGFVIGFIMAAWPCDAATKIRMAQPVIAMMYASLYFGVHQGTFVDAGFELEFMTMRTDLAIAALGTGDVDYIVHGGAALRAGAQGFPLKLIFAIDDKTPFWLAARPQIRMSVSLLEKNRHQLSRGYAANHSQTFSAPPGDRSGSRCCLRLRSILAHGSAESLGRRPRRRGTGAAV